MPGLPGTAPALVVPTMLNGVATSVVSASPGAGDRPVRYFPVMESTPIPAASGRHKSPAWLLLAAVAIGLLATGGVWLGRIDLSAPRPDVTIHPLGP